MQRADIIRGLPALDGRETLYRVTDRVFVHFYRLRQGYQLALKTPPATILDFMLAFYSRAEQKAQAMQHLNAGRPAEARIFADLARGSGAPGTAFNACVLRFGARLQRLARCCGEAMPVPIERILRDLEDRPEDIAHQIDRWKPETPIARAAGAIIAAQALVRLELVAEADERLAQEIAANVDSAAQLLLHVERGVLLFHLSGDRTGAIRCWATAAAALPAELPESLRALALRCRAWVLGQSGRHEEAIATARKAAELAARAGEVGGQAVALRCAAFSLGQSGRHEEAIATAREAAELAARAGEVGGQAETLRHAAFSLGESGRHEEAIATAREAAEMGRACGRGRRTGRSPATCRPFARRLGSALRVRCPRPCGRSPWRNRYRMAGRCNMRHLPRSSRPRTCPHPKPSRLLPVGWTGTRKRRKKIRGPCGRSGSESCSRPRPVRVPGKGWMHCWLLMRTVWLVPTSSTTAPSVRPSHGWRRRKVGRQVSRRRAASCRACFACLPRLAPTALRIPRFRGSSQRSLGIARTQGCCATSRGC
ncbi:MAG: tetratricopeptide repeat protein [Candidatus Accumulibacter phosphatis]|nr:tetratricopeptide repeat protein [Candidatus Accumulibacter phosphatis]